MRIMITESSVKLWLSMRDTYNWATKPGACWPCSTVSNKHLFAEFDSNGLVDVALNGRAADIDGAEFNAVTSDFLRDTLPKSHPIYFVTVGQFQA